MFKASTLHLTNFMSEIKNEVRMKRDGEKIQLVEFFLMIGNILKIGIMYSGK